MEGSAAIPEMTRWDSVARKWLADATALASLRVSSSSPPDPTVYLYDLEAAVLLSPQTAWATQFLKARGKMPRDAVQLGLRSAVDLPMRGKSFEALRNSGALDAVRTAVTGVPGGHEPDPSRFDVGLNAVLSEAAGGIDEPLTGWSIAHRLLRDVSPNAANLWRAAPVEIGWGQGQTGRLGYGVDPPTQRPLGVLIIVDQYEEIRTPVEDLLEGLDTEWAASLPRPKLGSSVLLEDSEEYIVLVQSMILEPDSPPTPPPTVPNDMLRTGHWFTSVGAADTETGEAAVGILQHASAFTLSIREGPRMRIDPAQTKAGSEAAFLPESPPGPDVLPRALASLDEKTSFLQAQAAQSDQPTGEDHLGATAVAQALSWTIALDKTSTPLCVAIFGAWGSGKSFLMRKIRDEIHQRKSRAPAALRDHFVANVRTVEFNAWTYAKGDLWSAMLYELLSQIHEGEDLPWQVKAERVEKAREELKTARDSLRKAEGELRKARTLAAQKEAERVSVRAALAQVAAEVQGRVNERLSHENAIAMLRQGGFDFTADALKGATRALGGLLPWLDPDDEAPWLRRWGPFFVTVVFVALAFFALTNGSLDAVVRSVGAVLGGLGALYTAAARVTSRLREVDGQLQTKREEVEAALAEKKRLLDGVVAGVEFGVEEARKLRDKLTALDSAVAGIDLPAKEDEVSSKLATVATKELELRDAKRKLESRAVERGIDEFVLTRLAEGDYAERLSHLQRVEEDLAELSTIMEAQDRKGGDRVTPDRIVLFIDDLDRCPPDKVVDVLEAIQLLLAENRHFGSKRKQPFVVILGADTRILTRALEAQYAGILDPELTPDGLDYLEKIVQIPYRVPPVDKPGYEHYVSKLTGVDRKTDGPPTTDALPPPEPEAQVTTASGTSLGTLELQLNPTLELLNADDLEYLDEFRPLAASYPRAIKRLVNQYRICKLMGARHGTFKARETAFLLSISSGFRDATRELTSALLGGLRSPKGIPGIVEQLRDSHRLALRRPESTSAPTPGDESDHYVRYKGPMEAEYEVLIPRLQTLKDKLPVPKDLEEIIRDVLPFCFLGDFDNPTARTA